ncbi:MAG: hypothetical protein KGJ60_15980 [Verrucomicrobiota bacterium]|nr:hypothetical protein [Verrucomicrobiota bacterium]
MSMDTAAEKNLLRALVELERAIHAPPGAGPKPDLLPLFSRIDELAGRLPTGTDPALAHYLRKKSYEKARLFLLGREAENQAGDCRRV